MNSNNKLFLFIILLSFLISSCCGVRQSLIDSEIKYEKGKQYAHIDTCSCMPKPLYKKIVYVPLRTVQWAFYTVGIVHFGLHIYLSTNNTDSTDFDTTAKIFGNGLLFGLAGIPFDYIANSLIYTQPEVIEHKIKYNPNNKMKPYQDWEETYKNGVNQ